MISLVGRLVWFGLVSSLTRSVTYSVTEAEMAIKVDKMNIEAIHLPFYHWLVCPYFWATFDISQRPLEKAAH